MNDMNAIELLEIINKHIAKYRTDAPESITRNAHLTGMKTTLEQEVIDAVLVDFINDFAAERYGIDYALSVDDFMS